MAYKNIPDLLAQAEQDWKDGKDTGLSRNPRGRPSRYAYLQQLWNERWDNTPDNPIHAEFNPFDDYQRAVDRWAEFKNDKNSYWDLLKPELKEIPDWIAAHKDILANPKLEEYISRKPFNLKLLPDEARSEIDKQPSLEEAVAFAKNLSKNGGYSPRRLIGYLTGHPHQFIDPRGDTEALNKQILDLWNKY